MKFPLSDQLIDRLIDALVIQRLISHQAHDESRADQRVFGSYRWSSDLYLCPTIDQVDGKFVIVASLLYNF